MVRKSATRKKAAAGQPLVDDFGLDEEFFCEYLEPLLDFLYTRWFRVEVSGIENVPESGRALLVANHSGPLPFDGPMIRQAIFKEHPSRRHVRYLVLKWLCSTPFLAPLMHKMGFVLACRENARSLLKRDELVGVFPEGIKGTSKLYKDRYRLARFGRGGFAEMALEAEAPIIPVAVVGGEETYPTFAQVYPLAKLLKLPYFPITPTFPWLGLLGVLPLPAKFFIHFGEPIRFKKGASSKADDYITINALSDMVRERIQREVQKLLARRQSVFQE